MIVKCFGCTTIHKKCYINESFIHNSFIHSYFKHKELKQKKKNLMLHSIFSIVGRSETGLQKKKTIPGCTL